MKILNHNITKLHPSGKRTLSIVVPAYKDEQTPPILVERLIQTFKENSIVGEIIVVDGGIVDVHAHLIR